jgi:hypothetical protein
MQGTGAGDYIADAELFPFTRTIMGRDGRVKYQSGVGKAHAIGNTHEQRYFYASPQQEKLDRLFGNHAGYSNHYQVALVEDANGQVSLSYTNLAGQVVATSLVGENPDAMVELESKEDPKYLVTSFDNDNNFIEEDEAWVIGKNIPIESAGNHYFKYNLEGERFDGMCGSNDGDCVYDLTIRIWNECEELMLDEDGEFQEAAISPEPLVFEQTFTIAYGDLNNDTTIKFMVDFPSIGTYYLEKRLSINDAAFQTAVNEFYNYLLDDEDNTCFDYDPLPVNYDGCMPCSTYCDTYPELCDEADCDLEDLLDTEEMANNSCSALFNAMVADMSPGGQYFDNLPSGDFTVDDGWLDTYIYDEGTQGSDINTVFGVGSTWADVRDNWSGSFLTNTFSGSPINGATSLLASHPEYCHYLTCSTMVAEGITEFAYDLMAVEDYSTANGNGWLGGSVVGEDLLNGGSVGIIEDPLADYSAGITPSFEDYMMDFTTYPSEAFLAIGYSGSSTLWAEAVSLVSASCSSSCSDYEWQTFRGMYLSARQSYINEYLDCDFLCDGDVMPDYIAENCSTGLSSTPTNAIGFEIRYPLLDYEEFNAGTFETIAESVPTNCRRSIELDLEIIMVNFCSPDKPAGHLIVSGVNITDASNPFDLCPTIPLDCFQAAQVVADAVNNYNSVPEAIAVVDGCTVKIIVAYEGPLYLNYDYVGEGGIDIGELSPDCISEMDTPNCFCTELNMNYTIFSELYESDEDIFTAMMNQMNVVYGAIEPI